MEENLCSWAPGLVVELIKAIAWPITVLIIGIRFRTGIFESIQIFFSKNTVSEVSASASGVSAKFVAAQQSLEALEGSGGNSVNLPENMSLEAIRQRHEEHKTEFSEDILGGCQWSFILTHLWPIKLTHLPLPKSLFSASADSSLLPA